MNAGVIDALRSMLPRQKTRLIRSGKHLLKYFRGEFPWPHEEYSLGDVRLPEIGEGIKGRKGPFNIVGGVSEARY
jgi:hypothetical protein